MSSIQNAKIRFNEPLIRRLVYAIYQAVSEDAPSFRREHYMETNNYAKFLNSDFINENLRKHVVDENIELHHFCRGYLWDGCLLIDHGHKVTYTVATFATLNAAPKKHGNRPYYLQSLLFSENREFEGSPKQMTIADYCETAGFVPFTDDEYVSDFDAIMQGAITRSDGYCHYIVAYNVERSEITDIQLLFLDRDFAEVDSLSLMDYVTPDFATLTESNYDTTEENTNENEEAPRQPYKLRPGLKPALWAMEEEA